MFAQILPILCQRRWSSLPPSQKALETMRCSQPQSPHQRGNSSQFPSLLLAGIMKTPYGCRFVSLFIWNPIEPSHPRSAVPPPPSHSAASKTSSTGWARLSSWSEGMAFSKACRNVASRQDSSPGAVAWSQGIFKAFVLPFQGSCSKTMILWIVIVIFRNEDLVQWVLHRDRPWGEILSQKESYSGVKSTQECFMQSRGFKVAVVVQGWIPAQRRTASPEGFSLYSSTCPVYFLSIQMEVVTAGRWRWRSPAAESSCGQQPPGSEEGWGLLQEPFLWL